MSLWTKIVLTLLYVPGALAFNLFWQLARPSVHRAIAAIDVGNPKLVAFVGSAVLSVVWVAVMLGPLYLIWRRPPP